MESGVSSTRPRADAGSGRDPGAPPVVSVRDISKSYGVVKALSPASLDLAAGEVHALCGENGSGKSTLVGIVSGTVKPETGTVTIDGTTAARHTPAEAQKLGALTVFQDGSVLPELSIAQNLYLGTPVDQRPRYGGVERWAAERLAEAGLDRLAVGARADVLSPADRQLLEIVRAMVSRPRVLLLDEATSALDAAGVDQALAYMRRAADNGTAVLFVTHRLSEVFRVADRISVLRDGVWRGTHPAKEVDVRKLVELMAGTSVDVEFPDRATPERIGEVVLSARQLTGPKFGPVDVELRAGEIVGVAGADDNGQLELLRGLATVGAPEGALELEGKPIAAYSQAVDDGLVFLSGDRRTESLFGSLAIRENLTVGSLGRLSSGGVVSWPREKRFVRGAVEDFGIRLGSPEHPISSLSGGNQQKVALARVLATDPKVVLIDEPTQGVDVRSRMDIYRLLRRNADKGLAVMIVSSDASELGGLCDRVLVCSRGQVVAEIAGADASEETIVDAFAAGRDGDGLSTLAVPSGRIAGPAAEQTAAEAPVEAHAAGGLRAWTRGHLDAVRLGALAVMILVLGGYAASQNETFLTTQSLYNVLFLAAPLAAVAAAQFVVLFVGGIDISVGATMAVTVVLMSFFITEGAFLPGLLGSLLIAVVVGVVVGAVNSLLIEGAKVSPVIATIATLGILQGVGLMLRPTAEGVISASLVEALASRIWLFPWAILALAALFVAGDWALRSTGRGLRMRAVGLNPSFAYRLGVNAPRVRQLAYVVCAIVAAVGGVLLSAQVGVGDSTVGNGFTLLAIAAPVLGGASLLGGYGSFVGCLLGAILLVLAQSLPTTLGISDATGFLLTGGLTLLALLAYTSGPASAIRTAVRGLRRKSAISGPT